MIPGEYILAADDIVANVGRATAEFAWSIPVTGRFRSARIFISSRSIGLCASIGQRPSACASTFRLAPRCASNPATTKR